MAEGRRRGGAADLPATYPWLAKEPCVVDKARVRKLTLGSLITSRAVVALAVLALAGCGSSQLDPGHGAQTTADGFPQARPQAIEPTAGSAPVTITPQDPVGDPNAHATPLSEVRKEIHLELVAAVPNNAGYINPLPDVTCCGHWERTDQGVDASMPAGAPIVAPSEVKILDVEPNWYAGQPLVYFELLQGSYAGHVQYVAEQITDIQRPGTILPQGAVIARFARSGTGIEYGWSTPNGITLAMATSGYEEGEITPAGASMREWLNALGAGAGPWPPKP